MKRAYLALGAAAVLAAMIGLYVALRADEAPDPAPRAPAPDPKIADPAPGKPRLVPAPAAPHPEDAGIDYTVGDNRIRDHRAGEHAPTELPAPRSPPQGSREIAPQVTAGLSQQLRPMLQACAVNVAPGTHGARSRIEGEIIVSIKDHQATVTAANLRLRDFDAAVQAELEQCLAQHAVGLVAPANDEADIDAYAITLSLRWP